MNIQFIRLKNSLSNKKLQRVKTISMKVSSLFKKYNKQRLSFQYAHKFTDRKIRQAFRFRLLTT